MMAGWPLYFDRWLIKIDQPEPADFIVCLTAGLGANNLPTEDGWGRIYSAVQLYFDGYAPKILFTGGGTAKVSEAEIYAEVARWFGCPNEAIEYEIGAGSTAEHPKRLLELKSARITRKTPLIVVTSPLHSRRTALCFKKQGYQSFKVIANYRAQKIADPEKVRELRVSQFATFRPSGKIYDDIFMRLRFGSNYFFAALREIFALLGYKIKGYI
ncbi:MAG: YdcF family protein [Candidatus Aminicenantes bacterium]|nr:YdcF family protein [Candidatus Aminicenantes bacterium]